MQQKEVMLSIVGLLIAAALALTWSASSRFDVEDETARLAFHRLSFLTGNILQSELNHKRGTHEVLLAEGIRSTLEELGSGAFVFSSQEQTIVRLNPHEEKWRNPEVHKKEIMAFWPRPFRAKDRGQYYVGVTFGHERTNMASIPPWNPFPIVVAGSK